MSQENTSLQRYLIVFAALLALLGATIGASFLELGIWALPVALAVAGVKAFLVAAYFMHLRYESSLNCLMACAGVFWLGILLTLAMSDILMRP